MFTIHTMNTMDAIYLLKAPTAQKPKNHVAMMASNVMMRIVAMIATLKLSISGMTMN